MTFENYTDAVLSALTFNPRFDDVVARKQEILDGVYRVENLDPTSVLFVGFNPAILSCRAEHIGVTEISLAARNFLTSHNVKFTYIDSADLSSNRKAFQVVVALDEYFTFADSDQAQQTKIADICSLASNFVISTLRDYKNQDFKDREFSHPAIIRSGRNSLMYLENHDWDMKDRNLWSTTIYEIEAPSNTMISYGPFSRRTMFFKQLAKFSMDAGAMNFQVHKNLMYKSLIKKNYDHVISIQFE
jgi:hypothetical protein